MTSMTAAVWEHPDAPLVLETIPRPRPQEGEALVRVMACGVCHTDLHVMRGEVGFPAPAVLGHEISGVVEGLGPGTTVAPVSPGQHVVGAFIMPCGRCAACERGRDDMCSAFFAQNRLKGTLYDGTSRLTRDDGSPLAMYSMAGLAEYAVVPVTALTPTPDRLDDHAAAVLGCAAFTAYGAVVNAADLQHGETVAVVATGGVGSAVLQLARARGAARIVAVDVSDEKLAAARELGATDVVNAADADAVASVRALTDGRGVDVVFEALGLPRTIEQAVGMLADGGRAVAVGIGAGTAAARIEITPLVRRGQRLIGSFGARTRLDLPAVVAEAAAGAIALDRTVTRRYPLARVGEAFDDLAKGRITGRAIITMGEQHDDADR